MTDFVFGEKSRAKLETCHPALRAVMTRALEISPIDLTIVCGWRGEAEQNQAFAEGKSKLKWPQSKHNHTQDGQPLSLAVDVAPIVGAGIPWNDERAFCLMAGVIFAAAKERGVKIRWGGDFPQTWRLSDKLWRDYPHFELAE